MFAILMTLDTSTSISSQQTESGSFRSLSECCEVRGVCAASFLCLWATAAAVVITYAIASVTLSTESARPCRIDPAMSTRFSGR